MFNSALTQKIEFTSFEYAGEKMIEDYAFGTMRFTLPFLNILSGG